jgi:polysaccharide biosynthesis/export protein
MLKEVPPSFPRCVMNHDLGNLRRFVSRRRTGCAAGACLALLLTAGCATKRMQVAQLLAGPAVADAPAANDSYRLSFPDEIELAVVNLRECNGRFVINPEGRIELPILNNPRVEGETCPGLSRRVASELNIPPENVQCRVVAHRSRVVYVHGPIAGSDRAVGYGGPENVVGFIRRCGGLTPAANVCDIHVVRGNVALGVPPQLFAVDLEAILLHGDPKSNVSLQPFDELYIGELPRAKVGKSLPQWLRPVYRGFCTFFPAGCPHDWRQQIRDVGP